MKVLFASPSTKFPQNIIAVQNAKQAILDAGHQLTLDLDEQTMVESVGNQSNDADDWRILAQRELEAVKSCDVAIFDVSDKATFGVGYLAAIALGSGRRTLFLMREGSLEGSFMNGLENKILKRSIYIPSTLANILIKYLKELE